MCTEKHILVKEIFRNGLKMGFSLRAGVEERVHVVETNRLSAKEKVPGAAVSKEGHADIFS